MKGTHVVAAALTCLMCASAAVAQEPDGRVRPQELREQKAAAKAQAQADAQAQRQATAQARGRAARGGLRVGQAEDRKSVV